MKKIIVLAAVLMLASGCAYHHTMETTYNPSTLGYDTTKFTQLVWFQKEAVKGLKVGNRTKTGSTTLSVSEASTETQVEALRAVAEGAAAGAVKGVRP